MLPPLFKGNLGMYTVCVEGELFVSLAYMIQRQSLEMYTDNTFFKSKCWHVVISLIC